MSAIASIADMLIDPSPYEPIESAATNSDPFLTSAERVYQTILRKIIQGEFPPGSDLPRGRLAELTGMKDPRSRSIEKVGAGRIGGIPTPVWVYRGCPHISKD